MPSWDDFEKPKRPEPAADEFAQQCALTFSSGPGARVLEMLRDKTIEKQLSDGASERALIGIEAQRRLVRQLEAATKLGTTVPKPAQKS